MSEIATLARPYAVAVFKRAKETSKTERWSEDLAFLTAIFESREIAQVISNPKINKGKLAELVLEISREHLNEEGLNFLKALLQNNRLSLLPFISQQYEALKAEDEGYLEVDVVSAYAFSKEAKQSFSTSLEKKFNKKIHMNVTVDKSLIGGVLVRAGDRVIDGTVRGQLQQLQKALM